jgi:hypothetical protein
MNKVRRIGYDNSNQRSSAMVGDDSHDWASELSVTAETLNRFAAVSDALELSPAELLSKMVERVVQMDEQLVRYNLPPLGSWRIKGEA